MCIYNLHCYIDKTSIIKINPKSSFSLPLYILYLSLHITLPYASFFLLFILICILGIDIFHIFIFPSRSYSSSSRACMRALYTRGVVERAGGTLGFIYTYICVYMKTKRSRTEKISKRRR